MSEDTQPIKEEDKERDASCADNSYAYMRYICNKYEDKSKTHTEARVYIDKRPVISRNIGYSTTSFFRDNLTTGTKRKHDDRGDGLSVLDLSIRRRHNTTPTQPIEPIVVPSTISRANIDSDDMEIDEDIQELFSCADPTDRWLYGDGSGAELMSIDNVPEDTPTVTEIPEVLPFVYNRKAYKYKKIKVTPKLEKRSLCSIN